MLDEIPGTTHGIPAEFILGLEDHIRCQQNNGYIRICKKSDSGQH